MSVQPTSAVSAAAWTSWTNVDALPALPASGVRVGTAPSAKANLAIAEHASAGESPWLIVGCACNGVLAAFEDRLLVVKVGARTSLQSSSFGGGRITTFPFTEITGIEFNAGMLMGVLEVLTPSYQGGVTTDFWQGVMSPGNSANNNPRTQSNTLPMATSLYASVAPHLITLRSKISAAKRPIAQVQMAAASGIATELAKLAELLSQGGLTADEFAQAEHAVISH